MVEFFKIKKAAWARRLKAQAAMSIEFFVQEKKHYYLNTRNRFIRKNKSPYKIVIYFLYLYFNYLFSQFIFMKSDLLNKIEILFFDNAFSEVSMDEIAKELNMKKPSLYYHFPSKEEMFLSVLNHSFDKYMLQINLLFEAEDIEEIIIWLISFPIESKNLFAVVSQKWYCKIWLLRDLITEKNKELFWIFLNFFGDKYHFTQEKTIIFQSVINDLSKKYCIFDCKEFLDIKLLVPEIKRTFF